MICIVNECTNTVFVKGLCSKHYTRQRRFGSTTLPLSRRGALVALGKSYCPRCDKEKSTNNFYKDIHTFYGISIYCSECQRKKNKVRYELDPEGHRNTQLKSDFGITSEQYNSVLFKQDNKCAICRKEREGRRLSVDHDHKTGKFRGILCNKCNLGLGYFNDSVDLLKVAINYIRRATKLPKK
jgi:hypothetical protein